MSAKQYIIDQGIVAGHQLFANTIKKKHLIVGLYVDKSGYTDIVYRVSHEGKVILETQHAFVAAETYDSI